MGLLDPKTEADYKKLQAREDRGEYLSSNEKFDLEQGYKYGVITRRT